ncbi:MAG: hypothetical protein MI723_11065, partial [Caulobacterales bacterium]|nr:hypothetical protein [Caulobacterales bacterium]
MGDMILRLPMLRRMVTMFVAASVAACVALPRTGGLPAEPESPYGAFLAARYAHAMRDTQSAAVYYRRALAIEPGNPLLVERAFATALAAGEIEEAITLARAAVELESADRLARVVLASREIKHGRHRAAVTLLEDQDLGPFNRIVGALLLAWAHVGLGDEEAALAALEDPSDAPGLGNLMNIHRALVLDHFDRAAAADQAFTDALSTGLLREMVVDAYGRKLEREGRAAEAQALYIGALSEAEDDPA